MMLYGERKRAEDNRLASTNALFWDTLRKYQQSRKKLLLRGYSYGQVFTPFCPSPLDNQTTIFRGHPDEKTMGTFTGSVTWLISSFHLTLPLNKFFRKWVIKHNSPMLSSYILWQVSHGHH